MFLGILMLLGMQGMQGAGPDLKGKQPIVPRGVIEGDCFRLVRDGKTLWEMMPTEDGSVRMRFSPSGTEVCKIAFDQKVVAWQCNVGGTVSDVVIAEGTYGNSVLVDGGNAVMNRIIRRGAQERQYACTDIMKTAYNEARMEVTPETARTSLSSGLGEAALELSAQQAVLSATVRDDVTLNVRVGDAQDGITCLGKLVTGFVVDLVNRNGKWSWANKK
jgi:hypothetical protein